MFLPNEGVMSTPAELLFHFYTGELCCPVTALISLVKSTGEKSVIIFSHTEKIS